MEKIKIGIKTSYIEIDKLLKLTNIVSSGGEAHMLILDGCIKLDDKIITEKRKKVYPNSIINIDNKYTIIVFEDHEA